MENKEIMIFSAENTAHKLPDRPGTIRKIRNKILEGEIHLGRTLTLKFNLQTKSMPQ